MSASGHGSVGTREQQFTELLPLRKKIYLTKLLFDLAVAMKSEPDGVHDGPDPEENLWIPAGYTYFGQFVDHDLTFDNTSSLNPIDDGDKARMPTNLRTPRFDLDSVYGDGPDAQPFLYDSDGASLLFKDGAANATGTIGQFVGQAEQDLLRSPNGRAMIGDKRNDENVLVGQIQLLFIRYHNAVVKQIKGEDPALTGTALFEKARGEVRWTYQTLIVEDFLPRLVRADVRHDLEAADSPDARAHRYALYTPGKRSNLPREFVVAAYRYGHSGVRQGYRLNTTTSLDIFAGSDEDPSTPSLLGFKPLPAANVIDDFARFFPGEPPVPPIDPVPPRVAGSADDPAVRLQFAYKLDTNIVDPLGALPLNILPTSDTKGGIIAEIDETIAPETLPATAQPAVPPPAPLPNRPSLALLNLLRGNIYKVQSGQEIARVLRSKGHPQAAALTPDQLSIRKNVGKNSAGENMFQYVPICTLSQELEQDTPLWLYILAEAQAPLVDHFGVGMENTFSESALLNGIGARTQLGWVGGRIIAEVFYGLLDADDDSFVNAAPTGWTPRLGGSGAPIFLNLVKFIDENP